MLRISLFTLRLSSPFSLLPFPLSLFSRHLPPEQTDFHATALPVSFMSTMTIRILGAHVYAHHGVGAAERELGGRYGFDVELLAETAAAVATDDIDATIDYVSVYAIAHDTIVHTTRRLLESIVAQIADTIMERFPAALSVTVRLRKLKPPIPGVLDAVEVELTMRRDESNGNASGESR